MSHTASPVPPGAPRAQRAKEEARLAAEGVGTALLLAAVVGSGIMGERLAGGNVAIALLANTLATGAALVALILCFGPISGAHFNPAVTLAEAARGRMPWREAAGYVAAQIAGAFAGVLAAHLMFGEPAFAASTHARAGLPQAFSEAIATFGLLSVIFGCSKRQPNALPFAVGAWITAAYWFTASTSFANPAVTLARAATNTFAGIRPEDVPGFVAAQLTGAALAIGFFRWLRHERAALVSLTASPVPPGAQRAERAKEEVLTIIFACIHNAGRSQMAAAFFEQLASPALARAVSAGTQPGERVHPEVVAAMHEVGIDLAGRKPRRLDLALAQHADWLITMGCGDECPLVPGLRRDDWPLPDPKDQPVERVREIRDELRARVARLVTEQGWTK